MDKSWADLHGGNWSDPSGWSPEGVPGGDDTALITGTGSYSVLLDQSVVVAGLALDDPAAVLLVAQGSGGLATSVAVTSGATVDAGVMDLAGSFQTGLGIGGQTYTIDAPVTFDLSGGLDTRSAGRGAGTILASIATLDLIGSQTLDHVTLTMRDNVELVASAGTLTLGAGFVLEQIGSLDSIDGALVNEGHLDFAGGPWATIGAMRPGDLTNLGTISIGAEEVVATARDFANAGLVQVDGIFDLAVVGSFTDTGTITLAAGSTLDLTADTTLAGLGRIDNSGGLLAIGGTLDLADGTLAAESGGAFADVLLTGTVRNGIIEAAGGDLSIQGATFDHVTYAGTLDLAALGTLTTLDVVNGLAVQGGTVDVTGPGDAMQFLDSETLDHLTINIGSARGGDDVLRGNSGGTLALRGDVALNVAGGEVSVSANVFINQGQIVATAGTLGIAASSLVNAGTLDLAGNAISAVLQAAALSNSGSIRMGADDTLVLQSVTYHAGPAPAGFVNTGTMTISNGSELVLDTNATLAGLGAIVGSGGTLEIAPKQAWFASQTGGVLDLAGGTLVIGGGSAFSDLIVEGTIENGTIRLLPGGTIDPSAGAAELNVTEAPCFLAGTRLATPCGDTAVESLAIGDQVLTASGESRPIAWIGQRRIDCRRHKRPEQVWPVRVRAHAFGPDQPQRDLFLSPDHAVSVPAAQGGGNVLPVKHLVNGLTIVQEPAATAHYFHVELAAHDVLLAEGLPAESYLDTGNRGQFANVGRHPDFSPLSWENACAPLRQSGADVAATQQRLHARAASLGWRTGSRAGLHVLVGGRAIAPAAIKGSLHRFVVPAGTRAVGIVSHSAGPARSGTSFGEWRRLGVCLGAVLVNGRVIALDGEAPGAGFHRPERGGDTIWRWTDGAAELSLGVTRGPVLLELLVLDGESGRRNQPRRMAA